MQNFLVKQVTKRLSNTLHTKVEIERVNFRLFNSFLMQGVYVEDQKQDTLLYAGRLTMRITDWFFFVDKPEVKFVGLQNAKINLTRPPHDSTWNYQFVIDAFSNPTSQTPSGQQSNLAFDLKKIDLKNIRFNYVDGWVGQDYYVSAKRIYMDADRLDVKNKDILINDLDLDQPSFVVNTYEATRPKRPNTTSSPMANTPAPGDSVNILKPLQWNNDNWKLIVKSLHLKNGLLGVDSYNDSTKPRKGVFKPDYIRFEKINLTLTNSHISQDSIFADLQLSTNERSGFEITKLTGRFKMSPVEIELDNMDLVTPNSHLRDYFTMQYNDLSDMNDFVDNVIMRANFRNSYLSSDDIAYFAPELSDWKTDIKINGKAHGPVSNLTGENFEITGGTATKVKGNLEMRGLPNIYETFISFDAQELTTNGRDILHFFPELANIDPVQIHLLDFISFKGNYTGFINDFVAYGNFSTNLGNFNSDLNFKTSGDIPIYSGNIRTDHFDLGALLNNNNFSEITANAKIDGAGFNFHNLRASLDAQVQELNIRDYPYQNITTKGELSRKFFNGSLEVDDPNLDLSFAGTIDFNGALPLFQFDADLRKSDLKSLHITEDSITLQAKAYLNFAGNSIDNFDGIARLYDVSLFKDQKRIEFDSLALRTEVLDNHQKVLNIQGSEISGYIKGDYHFMQFPNTLQFYRNKYFPAFYTKSPDELVPQDFSFEFNFGAIDKILSSFDRSIKGFNDTRVSGTLNTQNGNLQLHANVPYAAYAGVGAKDLEIVAKGDLDKINLSTMIGELTWRDSTLFENPGLVASSSKDTAFIKLNLRDTDTSALDGFYARLITVSDGVKINFLNSTFTMNEKEWQVTPGSEIYWSTHFLTIHNVQVSRNDQSIIVSTNEFSPDEERFIINIKNLNLADIIPVQLTGSRIEGLANGTINISNPTSHLEVDADIRAEQFRYADDSIGVVQLSGDYNQRTQQANFHVQSDNQIADFLADAAIGFGNNNKLEARLDMKGTSMSLLQRFIDPYVSNLSGKMTGIVTVGGTTDLPSVHATNLQLEDVGVTVNYLNTDYRIPKMTVNMDDNLLEFGRFTMLDKYNNTATVNGFITHDHFNKMNFEFDLSTNKFMFLNTKSTDNDLYYGDVIASAKLYFNGPINNLQLNVLARPLTNTHFYLPISDSRDVGKYEFIRFKSYGKEAVAPKPKKDETKLNMRLDIAANPDAQIDVILDQVTGDMISANGSGNLQINVNLDGDLSMIGNYVINSGSYNFSLRNFANWKFGIEKNSSITFNGDPLDAKVNIDAKYTVPKVSLYNLSNSAASQTVDELARRSQRVDILLNLTGALMQPDITYKIVLPEVGTVSYESSVVARLREINQDQNKTLYQIYGLLVSQQFLPDDASAGGANVAITGKNSVGQALSAQASAILNNLSNQLFKNSGIGFTINYSAYNIGNQDNGSYDRNLVSGGINSTLFNDRIRLYVGGDYDWGKVSATATSNRFAGDFRIEYLLTPDGRVRVNAFSKSDYDVYNLSNRNRGGVGISYIRDYNTFSELFSRSMRLRAIKDSSQQQQPPVDTPKTTQLPHLDSIAPAPARKDTIEDDLPEIYKRIGRSKP
ncbi:translocation/assembly module TamB domain-containing protein [Chitinophaga caeni]|nr:translocation/assembly module TamB domain-containing protein [Chitinophaga caeni]